MSEGFKYEKHNTVKKVLSAIGTAFFFASYIPCVYIVLCSIEGVRSGLFGDNCIYGFDAKLDLLTWFIIIPVIPVCFIYQLVFGIAYIRKRKILSVITLALVTVILSGILLAGIPVKFKKNQQISLNNTEIVLDQ